METNEARVAFERKQNLILLLEWNYIIHEPSSFISRYATAQELYGVCVARAEVQVHTHKELDSRLICIYR